MARVSLLIRRRAQVRKVWKGNRHSCKWRFQEKISTSDTNLLPKEERRFTWHGHLLQLVGVLNRADEIWNLYRYTRYRVNFSSRHKFYLTHEVGEPNAHDNGGQSPSNETLPGLFRTQLCIDIWISIWEDFPFGCLNSYLNEWCAAHGKAKHVGHDVVDDDHHNGHDEPDEALKHILDDQVALGDHT